MYKGGVPWWKVEVSRTHDRDDDQRKKREELGERIRKESAGRCLLAPLLLQRKIPKGKLGRVKKLGGEECVVVERLMGYRRVAKYNIGREVCARGPWS